MEVHLGPPVAEVLERHHRLAEREPVRLLDLVVGAFAGHLATILVVDRRDPERAARAHVEHDRSRLRVPAALPPPAAELVGLRPRVPQVLRARRIDPNDLDLTRHRGAPRAGRSSRPRTPGSPPGTPRPP